MYVILDGLRNKSIENSGNASEMPVGSDQFKLGEKRSHSILTAVSLYSITDITKERTNQTNSTCLDKTKFALKQNNFLTQLWHSHSFRSTESRGHSAYHRMKLETISTEKKDRK